jgi:hypothetical protein
MTSIDVKEDGERKLTELSLMKDYMSRDITGPKSDHVSFKREV